MPRLDRAEAGFTLIEALVALAVVAISVGAIAVVMGSTARGTRQLEGHVVLVQAAADVLWSELPGRKDDVPSTLSGEVARHTWRADFIPISAPLATAGETKWLPLKVALRVSSPSGAVLELETVRLFKRPEK
ncbi:MAG: type II secretion system protein [Xanthobacteraceae bacterium]|nr:type II secretion system protein [Xanthobacteraceae bacterium]